MQKSYILKFDEIKGDYAIVESGPRRQGFGLFNPVFFKKKDEKILENGLKTLENQQNSTNSSADESNLQNQNLQLGSVGDSATLLADLYNRFRILNAIYQNLSSINSDFSQIFDNFISINTQLQGGLLNIYYAVSGKNTPPQQNLSVPVLPSQSNEILKIVANYVQQMREINFQLQNMFEIEGIERQINLIESALSIQASQVTNLRLN